MVMGICQGSIYIYGRLRHLPPTLLVNLSRSHVVTVEIISQSEWAMVLFWDKKPEEKPKNELFCLPIAYSESACWELVLEEVHTLDPS